MWGTKTVKWSRYFKLFVSLFFFLSAGHEWKNLFGVQSFLKYLQLKVCEICVEDNTNNYLIL